MAGSLAKLRLAWRDLWAEGRRSIFFALLVAAGVASLVGVQGMARSMEASMRGSARQMIQSDVLITKSKPLTDAQKAVLHDLEHQGANVSEMQQITSHIQNGQGHMMIEVKVVDPKVWPFYGGYRTSPESVRPGKGEAVVGPELLTRMKLQVGDSITVGETDLKIVGTVLEEPVPLGQVAMGPRVLIGAESWTSTNPGGVEQTLIKLPANLAPAEAEAKLLTVFDQTEVLTSDGAWKKLADIMDKVFTFLSMVALISLLVGGLGVAMAMRTFISQKLEHIAVLKALGASSGTVISVFLAEAAMLGFGGSLVGAVLGLGVQVLLPTLFEGLVPLPPGGLNWVAALSGMAAGIAIAVLSALVPVRAIRAIKPVALFRGDTDAGKMGWKAWAEMLLTGLLTLAGVAWMAVIYAKSTLVGLGFLGGLLGATLLLFLLCWVLLKVVKLLPQTGRPAARHSIRSLHAPGNQSAAVVVSMGLGILLMTAVYLLQTGLIGQIKTAGAGPETPNLFIMSHKPENRGKMIELLKNHPKVVKVLDTTLAFHPEIVSVDGTSLASNGESGTNSLMLTGAQTTPPKGVTVLEGQWFTEADKGKHTLTVSDRLAKSYGVKVGSTVMLRIKLQEVPFTVSSIYLPADDTTMGMSMGQIATTQETMDEYADEYMVTAVTRPHQEEAVMRDLLDVHPEAMPVSLEAYLKVLETLLTRVSNILRFLTAFAVVAAGVILSGSLSATRFRRRKEGALLKTLGASRFTVAVASALENGLLGLLAGLAGGGLAYVVVQAAGMALKMRLELSLVPLASATAAGCLMAMLVGVGATFDVLQVKPLSVLRSE